MKIITNYYYNYKNILEAVIRAHLQSTETSVEVAPSITPINPLPPPPPSATTSTSQVTPIIVEPPETVNLMDVDTPSKNYIKMLEEIELEPLSSFVPEEIVSSCVQLMAHQQLDRDTLHAIMRVLVRLTKNYNLAEVFARFGGIDVLLNMKQNSGFIGFTTLATLLIRHVIEEPKTLLLAMQNVLVNRTLTTIPAGHRELLFLIRNLNAAVYRDPELFKEAALKILRVDFDSMKRSQINDEKRFIMKSVAQATNAKYNMEHSTAMSAVCKLLKALVEPDDTNSVSNLIWMAPSSGKAGASSNNENNGNKKTEQQSVQAGISTAGDDKNDKTNLNDKPLLNKAAILKILAESVKSYQTVALYITEHVYRAGSSPLITEDTSALSFILDKMFHLNDVNMDRECATMAQSLISAIASSDVSQAQETVVQEVKIALQRALKENETNEKHLHIEGLASLIPAMIDNNGNSNSNSNDNNQHFKNSNHTNVRHNIFYIMLEKGIITDLARAVQYLELGGPSTVSTINHLLKPLEMLVRLTNEPMPSLPLKYKKLVPQRGRSQNTTSESDGGSAHQISADINTGGEGSGSVNNDNQRQSNEQITEPHQASNNQMTNSEALSSSNNINASATITSNNQNNQNTTTNTDSTNAQDEQMLADDSEQNTDRDMSSAAIDSVVGDNELIGEVHLNEILETLMSDHELRGINEYADDANPDDDDDDNNEEADNEEERRRIMRNDQDLLNEGEESDSNSSDTGSNESDNEERELDEVGKIKKILKYYLFIVFFPEEIENDDEEEEAEERSEIDEDEETQPFEMYDHHSMYGRHLSPSIPEIERDHEDILMIQYSNNAQNNGANVNNNAENRENRTVRDRDAQIGGNISISVTNNENNANANEQPQNFLFNANFQQLLYNENSDQGVNENSNSAQGGQSNASTEANNQPINTNAPPPNNHPLLSGRPDGATERLDDRIHVTEGLQTARRSNRTRRYQFINISSRNQPVILQRMLELRQNRQTGQNGGGGGNLPYYFREGTRVVVMDNGLSIVSDADDHLDYEMVDQTGYWFGRTLANHLNSHPSALSWWQEENKISGPDSNSDLCMVISDEMIPDIDAARQAELSKIRGKRKKKLEEEEAKQKNQAASEVKKTNEGESGAEIHEQPDVTLSNVLTNVPLPIEPLNAPELSEATSAIEVDIPAPSNVSNNLNISFMDMQEQQQPSQQSSSQVTASIIPRQQQITTDQQLNLDMDFDMASDNDESSASANNSHSFSPNYSPNSNQVEQRGEMNMLNRETSSNVTSEQQQAQPQVRNLNIQDQQQEQRQQQQQDQPMDEDPIDDTYLSQIEASQVPLPTDDSDVDDTETGEDTEDEFHDNSSIPASPMLPSTGNDVNASTANVTESEQSNNENTNQTDDEQHARGASNNDNENAQGADNPTGGVVINQEIDPAIRAILGDLEVPEGVDPSFLAALPPEMRDEVIQEHLR